MTLTEKQARAICRRRGLDPDGVSPMSARRADAWLPLKWWEVVCESGGKATALRALDCLVQRAAQEAK